MTPDGAQTPRPPGPLLSAALGGAGFFFLAAAWAGLGPLGAGIPWARPLWGRPRVVAASAVRVGGGGNPGDRDALARDLDWLRARGPRLIVLEAWLDRAPSSGDPGLEAALKARFRSLRSARARRQALQALADEERVRDTAPDPLERAIAGGPVLLPYAARPGVQFGGLPSALRRGAYAVTLRGRSETLPSWRVERLPEPGLLAASPGLGAVPSGPARAVVGCGGLWLDGLGLEAVRLALGLPLDALRFHWDQGALAGLELAGRRVKLAPDGQGLLPPALPDAESGDLGSLEQDPAAAALLRGKVVFFEPWPLDGRDQAAFDGQLGLYLALGEPPIPAPAAPWRRLGLLCAALAAAAALLALAPLWLALPLWAAPVLWGAMELGAWPGLLLRAACFSLACLCLGLTVRSGLAARRRAALERSFRSRLAPGQWASWAVLLRDGEAALPAAYAALGPASLLRGPAFEAWMARWGLFLDEAPAADGAGFVLAGPRSEESMARALLDLRHAVEGAGGALASGTLVFRLERRLGFPDWRIAGRARDRAWSLFRGCVPGRFLLFQGDLAAFGDRFEVRPGSGGSDVGASPDAVVQVIGPRAGVWDAGGEDPRPGG